MKAGYLLQNRNPRQRRPRGCSRGSASAGGASLTCEQVGAEAGGSLDGGAVPPHVGEALLAQLLRPAGGADDAGHHLQVPAAQLQLLRRQQPAVLALVPGHPAARQTAVGRGGGHCGPEGPPRGALEGGIPPYSQPLDG